MYRQRKYASQSIVCVPRYCDADKKEDNAAPIRSMLHVAIRVVLKEITEIRMSKHQDCNLKSKEQNKPREKKRRYLIRHKLQNTCSEEGLSAPLQVQINQPIFLQGC